MTAGRGISHSEVSTPRHHGAARRPAVGRAARRRPARRPGVRPLRARAGRPATGWEARVFLGSLLGDTSPVATYTRCSAPSCCSTPAPTLTLDVDPTFEHGVLVDTGVVSTSAAASRPSSTTSPTCRPGPDASTLTTYDGRARVLVLGGPPFGEPIVMWWNFVARSHEEVVAFRGEWQDQITADGSVVADSQQVVDGRFGVVAGDHLPPIPAPALPNARLKQRH